jgi:cyclic beta-1,2-glucan synthetase
MLTELSEGAVARKALQLAREGAAGKGSDDRGVHVGFHLIDNGLPQLERPAAVHKSISLSFQRISRRFPLLLYFFLWSGEPGGNRKHLIYTRPRRNKAW